MSQNVNLFQIFGTKLRLPFMPESASEYFESRSVVDSVCLWERTTGHKKRPRSVFDSVCLWERITGNVPEDVPEENDISKL